MEPEGRPFQQGRQSRGQLQTGRAGTATAAAWHALDREAVFAALRTGAGGLSEGEAAGRLAAYGYNQIAEEKGPSPASIFAKQFKEPLVVILLAATAISAALGEAADAAIIMAIVVMASIVGFVQEYRSEKAMEALRRMAAATCRAVRGGQERVIDVKELVPGDVISMAAGDRVPADAYLFESFNLQADEAPLTGESAPVAKSPAPVRADAPVAERTNILHTATTVTYGRGRAVVFATGMETQLGRIASAVQGIERQKTPFEVRMRHLGKVLSAMMLAVVAAVSVAGLARGHELVEMLLWSISLAVAAVPEALPAVVATSLTLGVYQMAKRNAIVRRLPAVESLGSTTVICCDKTGTLTKGEMTVRQVYVFDGAAAVTGSGYSLEGRVENGRIDGQDLALLASCAALCNDASLSMQKDGKVLAAGDPTEAALVVFAAKAGVDRNEAVSRHPRVYEVPFTSERKRMTTVHLLEGGEGSCRRAYMKGAVETVVARCAQARAGGSVRPLDWETAARIHAANERMASSGLRVLAMAYKDIGGEDELTEEGVEEGLVFIGLAAMMDPPREETAAAVAQCRDAGIRVVMITGDHRLTAEAVAREIGIETAGAGRATMSGAEIEAASIEELERAACETAVYSRVSPEHKLRIVRALKAKGHVVAMTGDGTNDAPALKAADIGVAMGVTGTQVAKESSSMVLADDNFVTIVMAVREGRRIVDNVKKYLAYLLSANISEIALLTFAILAGWPFPLLAKHLLYINLATDGSPAIALGMEPAEQGVMKRRPRDPKEGVFAGTLWLMAGIPAILATTSLVLFWLAMEQGGWEADNAAVVDRARTMVFGQIVFFELLFALSCRSLKQGIVSLGLLRNKVMIYSLAGESAAVLFIMNHPAAQALFDFAPLSAADWALMLAFAATGFAYAEAAKWVRRRRGNKSA